MRDVCLLQRLVVDDVGFAQGIGFRLGWSVVARLLLLVCVEAVKVG